MAGIVQMPDPDFVLINTSHPGNIGAAARAMKNMGLERLSLVTPLIFPSAEATARASGADDLLAKATIHGSLDDAIADSVLIIGASARSRALPVPMLYALLSIPTPRESVMAQAYYCNFRLNGRERLRNER